MLHLNIRNFVSRLLLNKGFPQYDGTIEGLDLHTPVEVLRDKWGIPHIYAGDEHDLIMALGFVHAQDRLWQMETFRRMTSANLSEIAGEKLFLVDYFSSLAGFSEIRRRALIDLEPEDLALLEAYIAGINGFLHRRKGDLPLEFRSIGLTPEPWSLDDALSPLPLNAWFLQTNYLIEVLALKTQGTLSIDQWNELFPVHLGMAPPEDDYFSDYARLKFGAIIPAALAFHEELQAQGSGSQNWAVSEGEGGKPLFANDPHLGMMVPQFWYLCHLHCPTYHTTGVTTPGAPGMVIGRNESIAWGFTNVMTDCVDLYLFRVDPENPTHYYVEDKTLRMEEEEVLIRLPEGKSKSVTIYRTVHGPVITEVRKGVEAVAALKWYGTLPEGMLIDRSLHGFLDLNRAKNVEEAIEAGRFIATLGQNMVVADVEGHIGWHPFGAVPVRKGYSGRLPADGSSGKMDWDGFLPYDELPGKVDPPEGWLATANQKFTGSAYPHLISTTWAAPYRYDRIVEMLGRLKDPGVDDFKRMQTDCHSLQADKLLPKILELPFNDRRAVNASRILSAWDRNLKVESRGAAIYEVLLWQLFNLLLSETLGDNLLMYLNLSSYLPSLLEVILESGDISKWKGWEHSSISQLCETALIRAWEWLSKNLGRNPRKWKWGHIHKYFYRHPGSSGILSRWLLDRGPFRANGDCATLNIGGFDLARGNFEVTVAPSMRFIAPLSDADKTMIIGPMGQSGHPGHPHYDDMIDLWIRGEMVPLPFTRKAVEAAAAHRLTLVNKS